MRVPLPLPAKPGSAAAVTALLVAATLALYGPALRHFFIADDLTILDFVRSYGGSWLAFLDPARMYSDPVTHSRYKPLSIYYYGALDVLFRDHALAYHLTGLLLHALVGVVVWRLAWSLYRDRAVALLSAVLFVTWRLQCQTVVWIATSIRLASTALALLTVVWARERRGRSAVALGVTSFAIALASSPDLMVMPAVVALFVLRDDGVGEPGTDAGRRRRLAAVLLGCIVVAAGFAFAGWESARVFPERPITVVPDARRVVLFVTNLFVPFALPLWLKMALAGAVVVAALSLRDRWLRVLLTCVATSALLWGALRAYPLMPRYLYLPWAFGAIVVARLVAVAGAYVGRALPAGWIPVRLCQPERRCTAAVVVLGLPLVVASAWSIRSLDLVHFEYLGVLGRRLAAVQAEARANGHRIEVFVTPFSNLADGDLAFFRQDIRFARSATAADRIVDTDVERYRRRLGPAMSDAYWYFPWFEPR